MISSGSDKDSVPLEVVFTSEVRFIRSSPIPASTRAPPRGPRPGKLVMLSAPGCLSNASAVAFAGSSAPTQAASSCRRSAGAFWAIASSTRGSWRICGSRRAVWSRAASASTVFLRPAFFSSDRSWAFVSREARSGVGAAAGRTRAMGWHTPSRRTPTALRKPGKYSRRVRSEFVAGLGAVPDSVLLGSGKDGDGLGEFGVRREWVVGSGVSAQDVRGHRGVEVVGFLAGDAACRGSVRRPSG